MKQRSFRMLSTTHIWSNALVALVAVALFWPATGCKHDPILVDIVEPIDTTGNPIDTTDPGNPGVPCDTNTIYFEYDVLPILVSNCSVSGCHDPVSAESGVILTSYENVITTTDVEPFDLEKTDIYDVLFLRDPEDRMPPAPRTPLTQEQLLLITQWILQGAENLTCDQDTTCSTDNVSFQQQIDPIIATNCRGCHSGPNPSGGVSLADYNGIVDVASSGRLYGAIAHLPGFTPMPRNRDPLQSCEVDQIKSWVDAGAPNN